MITNKKKGVWPAVLAALLVMAMFFACTGEGVTGELQENERGSNMTDKPAAEDYPGELETFVGLDAETELRIRQDYLEQCLKNSNPVVTLDDVAIIKYYGTYNGCIVITTNFDTYDDAMYRSEEVDGVTFGYNGWLIRTWYDGKLFFRLTEVYTLGLLTQNDFRQIKILYDEFIADFYIENEKRRLEYETY